MVALAVVENQERRHTEINRAHKTHNPKSRCGNLSNTYTKPPKSPFHLSTDSCLQSDNGVSTSNNPVQQYLYSILIVALALSRIIPSRKSHILVLSLRPPCSCSLCLRHSRAMDGAMGSYYHGFSWEHIMVSLLFGEPSCHSNTTVHGRSRSSYFEREATFQRYPTAAVHGTLDRALLLCLAHCDRCY